jgi:transcriptional regulator with XRE-family HTH domain
MARDKSRRASTGRPPAKAKKRTTTSHPYVSLGSALVFLRNRTRRKQSEVADEAGLTKGMLSSYETGRQRPSLDSLFKLLEVLQGDFGDLQDALDITANRPLARRRQLEEEAKAREQRLGRAVLEVLASFSEALRTRSAPQLRVEGSIGGSQRRAG